MLLSRREAVDQFLRKVGEAKDTNRRDEAEDTLNRALQTVWMKRHRWLEYEVPSPYQITLVSGQRSYVLPDSFGAIDGRVMNLTRPSEILPWTKGQMLDYDPKAGSSLEVAGRPARYVLGGTQPIHTQVTASENLELVSASPADLETVVTIAGETSGVWFRQSFILDGTTPVQVGNVGRIDEFSKAYPDTMTPPLAGTSSRSTVYLRLAGGGAERGNLTAAESARQYQVITFYPVPNVTDVIAVPMYRRPKRLRFDSDALPSDWWPAVLEEMLADWRGGNGDAFEGSPRPQFAALVALDNRRRPRTATGAFGGQIGLDGDAGL